MSMKGYNIADIIVLSVLLSIIIVGILYECIRGK